MHFNNDRSIDDRAPLELTNNSMSLVSKKGKETIKSLMSDPRNLENGRWLNQTKLLSERSPDFSCCSVERVNGIVAISETMPNMIDVCKIVSRNILKAQAQSWMQKKSIKNIPFFLSKPLLLVGPAGCGKSAIGMRIADVMGVPYRRIDFGSGASSLAITGSERGFVNAQTGEIINAMTEGKNPFGNPLIIIDEIEKCQRNNGFDPSLALGQLLESNTAKDFVDNFLSFPVDCSKVSFILTANKLEGIPPHILDRVFIMHIKAPTLADINEIILPYALKDALDKDGFSSIHAFGRGDEFEKLVSKTRLLWSKYTDKHEDNSIRQLKNIIDEVMSSMFVNIIRDPERWESYRD